MQDCCRLRGGRFCAYINYTSCLNVVKVDEQYFPDDGFLMLSCRPFDLPQEFTGVFVAPFIIPQMQVEQCTSLAVKTTAVLIVVGD